MALAAEAASQLAKGTRLGIGSAPANVKMQNKAPTPNMAMTRFLRTLSLGVKELRRCAPPRRVAAPHGASHRMRRYKETAVK